MTRKNYTFVSPLAVIIITLHNASEDDAWETLGEIVRNTTYFRLEKVEEVQ